MLSDRDAFHLYFKHVRTLQEADIDVVKEICASYQSVLGVLAADPASEINRQTVATGFRLVDLLAALEMLSQAKEMLVAIINFLNVNPGLETWVSAHSIHILMFALLPICVKQSNFNCKSNIQYAKLNSYPHSRFILPKSKMPKNINKMKTKTKHICHNENPTAFVPSIATIIALYFWIVLKASSSNFD